MNINIVAQGFNENKSLIDQFTRNYDDELNKLLQHIGMDIINEARFNLSLKDHIDTGGLMGSLKILQTGDKFIVVGSDAPHAWYIEFGRGPVKPINAQALRFFDKKTGKLWIVKSVGPTEPSPFLQPAVETSTNILQGIHSEMVDASFL